MPGISVVVATYRRLERLRACLDGLRVQSRPADQVVVIAHADDPASAQLAARIGHNWPQLQVAVAAHNDTVTAYNLGLTLAREALVAYVDDDAVPVPDWLERIISTFEQDPTIAAVGGRDVIVEVGQTNDSSGPDITGRNGLRVGQLQWFGRVIANHHLGSGRARDVDVLKGANMSFRRAAVDGHRFDERLVGDGATVHSELSVCLPLRRRGLRIVYDPGITVLHHPAPRLAGVDRDSLNPASVRASAHNEALAVLDYLSPGRRLAFAFWSVLAGNTEAPGLVVMVRDLGRRRPAAAVRMVAAQRGRLAAWRTRARSPRPLPLTDVSKTFKG